MRGCDEGSKEGNEGSSVDEKQREMVTMTRKMKRKIMKCGMRKRGD